MRREVLKLYKDLLRYGDNLKLTDKKYYKSRVKKDFYDNIELKNSDDIQFYLEVIILIELYILINKT